MQIINEFCVNCTCRLRIVIASVQGGTILLMHLLCTELVPARPRAPQALSSFGDDFLVEWLVAKIVHQGAQMTAG